MAKTIKAPTSLRKTPKQSRSQTLFQAVLEASTRILESSGIEGLTTNKVAELAGVSIGSLYQYFPNKDAIFVKLLEDRIDGLDQRMAAFMEQGRPDIRQVIKKIVSFITDDFSKNRLMIGPLMAEVPKLKKTRDLLFRRNKIAKMFAEYLKSFPETLRDVNTIEEQVYVLSHAILGVLQVAVWENFESQTVEKLKSQLELLISSYLLREDLK